jgi:ankyrin repeat protein
MLLGGSALLLAMGCGASTGTPNAEPFAVMAAQTEAVHVKSLRASASTCDVEGIGAALERGESIDARDESGRTALAIACGHNCLDAAIVLIAAQADVHGADLNGATPLMQAARAGSVSCVELLLRHEPDLLATTYQGLDSTHLSAQSGHAECMRRLLSSGADVNRFTLSGQTPLMQAAQGGHVACVVVLLDHGADITFEDASGRTAVDLARATGATLDDPAIHDRQTQIIELITGQTP